MNAFWVKVYDLFKTCHLFTQGGLYSPVTTLKTGRPTPGAPEDQEVADPEQQQTAEVQLSTQQVGLPARLSSSSVPRSDIADKHSHPSTADNSSLWEDRKSE